MEKDSLDNSIELCSPSYCIEIGSLNMSVFLSAKYRRNSVKIRSIIRLSFPLRLGHYLGTERGFVMARKRHSDEDILKLLREVELKLANGSDVQSVCRSVGVSDATYYNWRKRFGGMGKSQLSELRAPKDDYALQLALARLAK